MKNQVLATFSHTLDQAKSFVADVPCERFAELPHPGAKHPGWVLGHLACGAGMAAAFLAGEEGMAGVPEEWVEHCAPGTELASDRRNYGKKDELIRELERLHTLVADRYGASSQAQLDAEFPNPEYRAFFPTIGAGAFYLMVYHEGYHLGQLSAWRRAAGLGPAAQ